MSDELPSLPPWLLREHWGTCTRMARLPRSFQEQGTESISWTPTSMCKELARHRPHYPKKRCPFGDERTFPDSFPHPVQRGRLIAQGFQIRWERKRLSRFIDGMPLSTSSELILKNETFKTSANFTLKEMNMILKPTLSWPFVGNST